MAITNEQIIMDAAQQLLADGKLKPTGRTFTVEINGEEIIMQEPEPIHTFQMWKALGFKVKKGEHAIARLTIWKYAKNKVDETQPEEEQGGRCFKKESCFFSLSQVEQTT